MKTLTVLLSLLTLLSSTPTLAVEKWLEIQNHRKQYPIVYVYITKAGSSTWETDELGEDMIYAGHKYRWTIPWRGCKVDMKAVTFTGMHIERYNVNVCGGFIWHIYDQ